MTKKDVMALDSKKTLRWTLYFTGGILVVLGLWAMTYPVEALMSLALFLGGGFVLGRQIGRASCRERV